MSAGCIKACFLHILFCCLFLFLIPKLSAQSLSDRINQLNVVVGSLPSSSPSEQVKKAVLELALERAQNALDVSYDEEAENLARDVLQALYEAPSKFTDRNPNAANLSIFRPLYTTTDNPYLDAMINKASTALASPDAIWPRTTPTQSTYNNLGYTYGVRSATHLARDYFILALQLFDDIREHE